MLVTTRRPDIETSLIKVLVLLVLAAAGMAMGLRALGSQRQMPGDYSTTACLTFEQPFVDLIPVLMVETSSFPHFSVEPNAATPHRLQRSSVHAF